MKTDEWGGIAVETDEWGGVREPMPARLQTLFSRVDRDEYLDSTQKSAVKDAAERAMAEAAAVRPSLGERFGQNALTAFSENTLLGSQLRAMAAGPSVKPDELPKTSDERNLAGIRREIDRRAGKLGDVLADPSYADYPDAALTKEAARYESRAAVGGSGDQRRQEISADLKRQRYAAMMFEAVRHGTYEGMPEHSGFLEGLAAAGGQVTGGMASPENLMPLPGGAEAKTVIGRAVAQGAGVAAANVLTDPLVQEANVRTGTQDEFSGSRLLEQGVFGFLAGAGLSLGVDGVRSLVARVFGGDGRKAKAVVEKMTEAAKPDERLALSDLSKKIDAAMGIGAPGKDAEESAAALSAEHPPVVKPAAESAQTLSTVEPKTQRQIDMEAALAEQDATNAKRGAVDARLGVEQPNPELGALNEKLGGQQAEGAPLAAEQDARALEAGIRRNQVSDQPYISPPDANKAPLLERAQSSQPLAESPSAITGHSGTDINASELDGVKLSAQAQRVYDQHGVIDRRLAGVIAGSGSGVAYGFSQGDTPEERAANALKYGILGLGVGLGAGSMFQRTSGSGGTGYRTYLEGLAKGTDGMPQWYQRFRTTEPIVQLRELMLNTRARVKDVVASTPGEVSEDANPYLAGKLFPGRVAARIKVEAERAAQAAVWNRDKAADLWAKANGQTAADFSRRLDEYMVAKTAPDYNREHADFSTKNGQPAAGISDADAAKVIAAAKADGLEPMFEDLRKQVRALDDAALDTLEDAQLISPVQAQGLRRTYPEHIPLNRIMPDDSDDSIVNAVFGVPRFNMRSSGIREGAGSSLAIDDVYASVLTNLKDAIIRAERNKVSLSAVSFYEQHPTPGVLVKRPKPIGISSDGTPILPQPETNATLIAREVTDAGKPAHQVWVEFDDPLLARAFNGMNIEQTNTLLRWLSVPTKLLGGLYTRFNVGFIPSNKLRDLQEAVTVIATSGDWKAAAKVPAQSLRDMRAVSDWLRGKQTPDAAAYEEIMLHGGFTGGLATSTRDAAEATISKAGRQGALTKAKGAAVGFFDFLNEVAEDSTRLTAARAAKDAGASDSLAALAGREAGVDFNMKGTATNQVAALYAFVNPGVQGTVRAVKAAIRKPETIAAAASAFLGVGLAVDAWNRSIDPDWKRRRSMQAYRTSSIPLIVGDGDSGYYVFTLPVAQILRPVKALVDFGIDLAAGEVSDVKDAARRAVAGIAESVNPLGGQDLQQALTPTIADPIGDVLTNQSFTGSKIHPEGRPGDPEFAKVWPETLTTKSGMAALSAARILDRIGVQVSPESLVYLARSYTGGPGEIGKQAVGLADAAHGGTIPQTRDIPIVSRFVRFIRNDSEGMDPGQKRIITEERTKSAVDHLDVQAQAQAWITRAQAADLQGKQALLAEIATNPQLKTAIASTLKRQGERADPTTSDLRTLTVADGARSRAIIRLLRAMPEPDRLPALQRMQAEGIITKDVLSQIAAQGKAQQ